MNLEIVVSPFVEALLLPGVADKHHPLSDIRMDRDEEEGEEEQRSSPSMLHHPGVGFQWTRWFLPLF